MARMKSRHRWHMIGLVLTLLMIVSGELLWLLDPIKISNTYYWIDLLEYVILFCVLPLCFWIMAAACGLLSDKDLIRHVTFRKNAISAMSSSPSAPIRKVKWAVHGLILLRITLIISATITGILILFAPHQLFVISIGFSISLLCVLSEMTVDHWSRQGRIPLVTLSKVTVVIALLLILLFPTKHMVTYPGLTVNMNRYATAEQSFAGQHQPGNITGVLVFERPAFPIDRLYASLFAHYEFRRIQPSDPPLGDQLQMVRSMKHDADQLASAYAFAKVGLGDGLTYHGVRVLGLLPESPAATVLQAGDIIIGINGLPVRTVSELLAVMNEVMPGTMMALSVKRQHEVVNVHVETMPAAENPKRSVIGIQIADETRLDLPLDVNYRSYLLHEGGPSHGAMLALTIIDQLTPGGVVGDRHVAGTGTIQADGMIGKIGGIKQKAYIVERAGADVFFVPQGQEIEARQGAAQLKIVPVKTMDDILNWLDKPLLD